MRASVANFYRDNFTRIWWAVAGGLLVGAIVLLGANQIKIRDTANRAEHASQVAQAASEDAAHAIVRIQHERSERIAADRRGLRCPEHGTPGVRCACRRGPRKLRGRLQEGVAHALATQPSEPLSKCYAR